MTHHFGKALAAAALALAGFSANAASVAYTGNLGDASNPYLHDRFLDAPVFTDPDHPGDNSYVVSNNVALYQLILTQAGTLTITSDSLANGGIDSLVSLWFGSTTSATLVGEGVDDFTWTLPGTAAGSYWVSIGTWNNDSYADNPGGSTLVDGFDGLGQPDLIGNGNYDVVVSLDTGTPPPPPVPEPSEAALLMLGLAAIGTRAWRARRAG